jgi:hypothetical protein
MIKYAHVILMALLMIGPVTAQQLQIAAPDDWRADEISLPPEFAPEMGLRGDALMRFPPGMFNRDSADFFSYVFVMRASDRSGMTGERIHRELLSYYQGLSVDVAKLRGIEVDTDAFVLKMKSQPTDRAGEQRFSGKLSWLEPFSTGMKQDLYLEIDSWRDDARQQNYLFVCASPTRPNPDKTWSQLRGIRDKSKSAR